MLLELAFNFGDQLFALMVNFILGIKQGTVLGIALLLKGFNLFLPYQLVLERECSGGCAATSNGSSALLFFFAIQISFTDRLVYQDLPTP